MSRSRAPWRLVPIGATEAEPIGPWRERDNSDVACRLRWRGFGALALLIVGPTHPLTDAAREAEFEPAAAGRAWAVFQRLDHERRRRLLDAYRQLTTS